MVVSFLRLFRSRRRTGRDLLVVRLFARGSFKAFRRHALCIMWVSELNYAMRFEFAVLLWRTVNDFELPALFFFPIVRRFLSGLHSCLVIYQIFSRVRRRTADALFWAFRLPRFRIARLSTFAAAVRRICFFISTRDCNPMCAVSRTFRFD